MTELLFFIILFATLFFLYKIIALDYFVEKNNYVKDNCGDDYIHYDDCNHLNMYYKKTRGKNR